MEIKINKEIRDYTESVFMGLSLRQVFFSGVACILAIIVYFASVNKFGVEITSWFCIFVALTFAGLGFISYQGMNFEKIVIALFRSLLLSRQKMIFKPDDLYYRYLKDIINEYRKESLGKNDKKLRKIEKTKQRKI